MVTHSTTKPRWVNPWSIAASLLMTAFGTSTGMAQTPLPFPNPSGFHRAGPLNPNHQFPEWYQDKSGIALEFGTPLTSTELAGGWVLLLPSDTVAPETYVYPRAVPSTFFDEHFYWHCATVDTAVPIPVTVDPAGVTRILVEFALEAAFSSGPLEEPGSQIVFSRQRIVLVSAPYSGTYTLETPFKTLVYENVVAGERLFQTEDFGVAAAPEGFQSVLGSNVGPFLLPAQSEGGPELPPVDFEGRKYIADPGQNNFITGSPIGRNFVRLTGPNGFVWQANQFNLTGRLKTGAIPSNISVDRVSKFDAPTDRRIDIFATGAPTLQPRLPAAPLVAATHPSISIIPAPPVLDPVSQTLSAPPGIPPQPMLDNGPLGRSFFLEVPLTTIPPAITAVDDAGFVTLVPVTDTVVVTEADYSPTAKTLTVAAATANLNAPPVFYLGGVDGVSPTNTFTSSIQIPNLNAPPSKVTVFSSAGGASTVSVTVGVPLSANNTPPVAADDLAGTIGADPVVIPVLLNDSDADKDRLTIDTFTQPAAGSVTLDAVNQTLTFTANQGARGLQSFQYTITDRRGGFSTAQVTVEVDGAPIAATDNVTITTGVQQTIQVLANASDPDGDPLTIVSTTTPSLGGVALGSVSITGGGTTLTYSPFVGSTGIHVINYTITDGRGGFATGTVNVTVNTPPVARADQVFDLDGSTVQIQVLLNDSDVDQDQLNVTEVSDTPRGTVSLSNNTITFSPLADVLPIETLSYTISDGRGGTNTSTITIIQNATPKANGDVFDGLAGSPVTLDVLANDEDTDLADKTNFTITGLTQPSGASATISTNAKSILFTFPPTATTDTSFQYTMTDGRGGFSNAVVTVRLNHAPTAAAATATAQAGVPVTVTPVLFDSDGDPLVITAVSVSNGATFAINSDNTITFTPSPTVVLSPQTFTYSVTDGRGGNASATVTVSVNNRPTPANDSVTTAQGTSVAILALANDTDPNGDPITVSAIALQSANGIATIETTGANANRAINFFPNPGFTGVTSFQYSVSDGRGGTANATVTITVSGVANRVPIATADTATTRGTTAVVINVLNNDTDPDNDTLTVTAVTSPGAGLGTAVISNAGRSVTYTPTLAASAAPQSFTYTVSDGRGGTATATVTVTVNDVVTITQTDYTVARSTWAIQGTAGPSAVLTIVAKDSTASATGTTIATVQADTRGAWRVSNTLTIPTTRTVVVVTSNRGGSASRAIVRR